MEEEERHIRGEMLEGLVRQLLLGYLGRYVKDIQKEQLKITLWNGNVFFLCFGVYEVILTNNDVGPLLKFLQN